MVTHGVKVAPSNALTIVIHVVITTLTARITSQTEENHGVRVAPMIVTIVMIAMNGTLTDAIVAQRVAIVSFTITITDLMLSSTLPIRMNACSLV
jgi:hypothetical protein